MEPSRLHKTPALIRRMEMNPSGKRKYSGSEILNSLRSGERIVYAAGNCGRT